MASNDKKNHKEGIEGSDCPKPGQTPMDVSTSRRMLLTDGNQRISLDSASSLPSRINFLKFGSASAKFRQIADEKDEISRSVSSSSHHHFRERISGVLHRKLDWPFLLKMSKEWIRNPMNMALFVWITCVAVSGAILFLVMTGMLNAALPGKSQRNAWFEVNNQILNALFTLMCLYQHPKRFYHLVLLCRWRPEDVSKLRKIYCKNGTYKPHEWAHMMVVVLLLHLNCFAQYALCGLNIGYKRSERPAIGVGICISFAIGAPAFAGVYSIISPLGKDYHSDMDEEAQGHITTDGAKRPDQFRLTSLEKRFSFTSRDEVTTTFESKPQWSGGILDIWDDISLAYLSLFCSFCVFGWNMERLGFGNMYVHIATFILFCVAPFWIFILAAVNIDNEAVREGLGLTGVLLCGFGLLYGGFWRIRMRKRYNLPGYKFCFGRAAITDCALWLFCCWCSLAQEVRTGNFYDISEDKFCRKDKEAEVNELKSEHTASSVENNSILSENRGPDSSSPTHYSPEAQISVVDEDSSTRGTPETMTPPAAPFIDRNH